MRAKITAVWGHVIVERDDPISGDRIRRSYHVPDCGGYVRDDRGRQVCERLDSRGATLRSSALDLPDVIRREYRRRVARDRKAGL